MNGRMEELLAAGDGIACRDARLRFRHPRSQRTLDGMLARRGLEGSGGAFRVPRPSCAPDYEVVVIRLPEARDASSALIVPRVRSGWLVLVSDPARDVGRALPGLRRLHDLTEAEAEVARLLFAGMSLREVGEARGTSLDTVKSQTRSLYAKVGVSSRAELVRRLSVLERGPGAGRSGTS